MQDDQKTKKQLLQEIDVLRRDVSQLKQAEAALRQSERQFKEFVENLPVGIYRTTPAGRVIMANPALVRMLGYSSFEELAQRNLDDDEGYEPGYSRAKFKERIEKEGRVVGLESAWIKRDGTTLFIIENSRAVRDEDGNTLYYEGTAEDITRLQKARADVNTFNRQMEFVLGATKTGLDIIDSQFNIRYVDRTWQEIYGNPTGKKCYQYFMGRKRVCPGCGIKRAFQTKNVVVEEHILVKEGDRPIQVTTIPFQDVEGEWLFAEINVDISELKQRDTTLHAILNATTESVLLIDRNLNIVSANTTAARRFGRTVQELVGVNIRDLASTSAPLDLLESRIELIDEVLRSGKPAKFQDERGAMFIESSMYPVFDPKGDVSSVAVFAKNITEECKSKAQLEESRLRYKTLFDNVPVGIGVTHKDGRILECNEAIQKMTGYSYAELRQISIKSTYVDLRQRRKLLKRLQSDGSLYDFEVRLKRKDGMVYDASVTVIPFILSGEQVLLTVQRDITEQKMAQRALHESEMRFKAIFDGTSDGVFLHDLEANKLSICNKAFLQMLGYTQEEFVNLTTEDLHPKEGLPFIRSQIEEFRKGRKGIRHDIRFKRKDGSILFTDLSPAPITLGAKKYILVAVRDISEQKKAQEQSIIRDKAFASSINAVAFADPKGRLTYVNRSFLEMWGYKNSKQVIGKSAAKFWLKQNKARKVMQGLIERENWVGEMTALREDGSTFETQAVAGVVKGENGRIICMMASFLDITESKRARAQLKTFSEKMTQTERLVSLGTLSATIAHELTQPLSVIGLSIENALEELRAASCDRAVAEQLNDSLSGVAHMTSIIDRVRNFARSTSTQSVSKVDLNTITERITELLSERALRAGVSLLIKDMDKLPSITASEKDIEQLFFVLLDNAIQAADGKKDRRVLIMGSVKCENIELRFSDNSGGIAPEHIEHLFEPFFTTKASEQGTGLGLSIAQRIVDQHGGKIWVKNRAGRGVTFFVTLPVKGPA